MLTLAVDAAATLAPRDARGRAALALLKALVALDESPRLRVLFQALLRGPGREHAFLLGNDRVVVERRRGRSSPRVAAWAAGTGPTVEQLLGPGADAFLAIGGPCPPSARPPRVLWSLDDDPPATAPAAELILAPSAHRLGQLRALGVDAHRLALVPAGFDADVFRAVDERLAHAAAQNAGLAAPPFLVARSSHRPGARNALLLDAYAELLRRQPRRCPDMVVLGWAGKPPEELRARPALHRRVVVLPPADEELMAGLLSGAAAVLLPAREAAHGLDMVEALACGAPVVCAAGSANDEFGADAVTRLEGEDAAHWADAVEAIAFDEKALHAAHIASREVSGKWTSALSAAALMDAVRGLVV